MRNKYAAVVFFEFCDFLEVFFGDDLYERFLDFLANDFVDNTCFLPRLKAEREY